MGLAAAVVAVSFMELAGAVAVVGFMDLAEAGSMDLAAFTAEPLLFMDLAAFTAEPLVSIDIAAFTAEAVMRWAPTASRRTPSTDIDLLVTPRAAALINSLPVISVTITQLMPVTISPPIISLATINSLTIKSLTTSLLTINSQRIISTA